MRRFFAAEVVQSSAMDCGPASLKCVLEGHGVRVSYDRLREACQTDVDGTSIDTLEVIANDLGLDAEQVMLPVDHVLLDEARALPALIVVRLPNGFTHFVVAWRRHGPLVQVMDPGSGRRWLTRERFVLDLFVHEMSVPVESVSEWMLGEEFRAPLERRMRDLGLFSRTVARFLETAMAGGWRAVATLDAAVRLVASLRRRKAVRGTSEVEGLLAAAIENDTAIPPTYFTARADPDSESGEHALLRGAVLVKMKGTAAKQERAISPDLARALKEPPARPLRTLLGIVRLAEPCDDVRRATPARRRAGWLTPSLLAVALVLAALGALAEAMLFRAALDVPRQLGTVAQRVGAAVALVVFVAAARTLEIPILSATLRLGRQVELHLRRAFFAKLPLLGDRYFQSRPLSDMAERAHAIKSIRELPQHAARFVRAAMELLVTAGAIAWLYPASAALALTAGFLAIALPLMWQPVLSERDMRMRSHAGALGRWSLDALLALVPIRTHAAERSVAREHESLLGEWRRASRALVRATTCSEAIQSFAVLVPIAWMIARYASHTENISGVLLLAYWGFALPSLGEEIATALRQIPGERNVALRLLEPLGATEEKSLEEGPSHASQGHGVAIQFQGVHVRAAGHTILREVDVSIGPGEHVAIVGPSGAGKSSLVSLLLGWHRASEGRIEVDGEPLEGSRLDALRRSTAWVDPAVQVWNRSLIANLRYGAEENVDGLLARILEGAEVERLLDRLPQGLQTALGEGGALVSGGEGQRVRLGRAMMRPSARLVIFDEPFRGLERARRRELLARSRTWWKDATLLCITHDLSETLFFDRVLVVENGRIVEDGSPRRLSAQPNSRLAAMLRSERALLETMWGGRSWTRWRMEEGRLIEGSAPVNRADGKEVA